LRKTSRIDINATTADANSDPGTARCSSSCLRRGVRHDSARVYPINPSSPAGVTAYPPSIPPSVTASFRNVQHEIGHEEITRHESSKADQHYKLQASLPLVDDRVQLHWTTTQREDARSGYTSCNSPTMLVREVRGAPRSSSFTTPASSPVPSLDSLQAHQTDLKRQRINIQRAISHMEEALKANPTGGWDFAKKKLLRMDRFKARLEEMKLSEDVARVRKEGNEGQR
ncbi:hypothetical protein LTR56_028228, partial [Elasticomyces elasticus]